MTKPGSELQPNRILHLAAAVGLIRTAAKRRAETQRRIVPHERVRRVVGLQPQLQLIALCQRQRLRKRGVEVPETRPRNPVVLQRICPRRERFGQFKRSRIEPRRRTGIIDARIADQLEIAEPQERARVIRHQPVHGPSAEKRIGRAVHVRRQLAPPAHRQIVRA